MPSALDIAARIMGDDLYRLNLVSQNLANATTAGYKRSVAVAAPFSEHLQVGDKSFPVSYPVVSAAIDPRQASLTQTGSALDVALESAGFFEIAGAEGPVYSRQGAFHLDATGRLVNTSGLAVMGVAGDITLTGNQPRIDRQGRVFEGEQQVAQLKIVRFANPASLVPLGAGLYRATAAGDTDLDALQVRQGFLEASNVTSLNEMIAMIGLTRRFESAQRVVQNYDGMLGTAIQKLGEF